MSANQEGKGRQFAFDRRKQLKGAQAKMGCICDTYCIATFFILGSAIGLLLEERYVSCICDTVTL